ncbi:hypothetical protein GGX14DRAFT_643532, partial [Mycena pura]
MNSIPTQFLLPESDRFEGRSDQSFTAFEGQIIDACTARGILGYLTGTTLQPMSNPIQPIYVPTPWFSPLPFDEEFAQREAFAHGLLFGNIINPVALGLDRAETTAKSWAKL